MKKKKEMIKRIAAVILLVITLSCFLSMPCFAHRGKTDENGGHWDNSSGEYHYHCGGHAAHQHRYGVCPYDRIPVNTPEYKDSYGGGTSVTKNEKTTEWYEYILYIVVLGPIAILFIYFFILE